MEDCVTPQGGGTEKKPDLGRGRSLAHDSPLPQLSSPPTLAPSPEAVCQELLMNLFSRQPCYLGLRFRVRECTRWDLKPNHLLHSPTPLPDSQPSPFTKHQFLGTLSHRYLPFGMAGLGLTGGGGSFCICVCVLYVCVCVCMCDLPSVCPEQGFYVYKCVCERVMRGEETSS